MMMSRKINDFVFLIFLFVVCVRFESLKEENAKLKEQLDSEQKEHQTALLEAISQGMQIQVCMYNNVHEFELVRIKYSMHAYVCTMYYTYNYPMCVFVIIIVLVSCVYLNAYTANRSPTWLTRCRA